MKRLTVLLLVGLVSAMFARPSLAAGTAVNTWGKNLSSTPMQVGGLPNSVVQVQAANWGGLAIDGSGNVWQWTSSNSPYATRINGPSGVISVGEGGPYVTGAAVTSSGTLWTWGADTSGQLCNQTTEGVGPVAQVSGVTGAEEVTGGAAHMEFLLSDGVVEGCGNNALGQLGTGNFANSDIPVAVKGLTDVQQINAGSDYNLALDGNGNVWAWGNNSFGQLGNGNTVNSDVPLKVSLPGPAVQVYAGGSKPGNGQSMALLENGTVWAWGNDSWGQLGNDETETDSTSPVQVQNLGTDIVAVATGGAASYALDGSGDVYAWGQDEFGQLGDNNSNGYVLVPEIVASGYAGLTATAATVVGSQ